MNSKGVEGMIDVVEATETVEWIITTVHFTMLNAGMRLPKMYKQNVL